MNHESNPMVLPSDPSISFQSTIACCMSLFVDSSEKCRHDIRLGPCFGPSLELPLCWSVGPHDQGSVGCGSQQ